MKNNRYEDERVKMQKLKIGNEALSILMFLLLGSTLVKQFVFKASFSEYIVEFIGFFGTSLYIVIRNIFVGNTLFPNIEKKAIFIIPIITAITVTIVSFLINLESHLNSDNLPMTLLVIVVSFLSSAIGSFVIVFLLYRGHQTRSKKLEEKFDD